MENRSHALMTGFFTITLLIAAVLFGLWFNRDRVERVAYQLATVQPIPGLNRQAAVRYRGLEVGKVSNIDFDPKVAGQILVDLSIDPDAPITKTTFATLGYQGVTGIAFIQLDDDATGSPPLATRADQPSRIPLRPGLFDQLEKQGRKILAQTEQVATRLSTLLSPDNQKTMLAAFSDVSDTAKAYKALPDKLDPVIGRLPALADQLQSTLKSVSALATDARRMTSTLQAPGGTLERINGTVDRVGQSLEAVSSGVELETLPQVTALAEEGRSSMRTLKKTMTKLGDSPQSILFGTPDIPPGPGEPGFTAPTR